MNYFRADSVTEARRLIGEGCIPLAGGTVLVPRITLHGDRPGSLVDIAHIDQMKTLEWHDKAVEIGAAVTMSRLAATQKLGDGLHVLVVAARGVGNPQVRRAATLGGNLAVGLSGSNLTSGADALLSLYELQPSPANQERLEKVRSYLQKRIGMMNRRWFVFVVQRPSLEHFPRSANDAGMAVALNKPLVVIYPPELQHALKGIDAAA